MARINVDDEFLKDPRLSCLSTLIPRHEAIGAIVTLWELGQSYWKRNKKLIPLNLFKLLPCSEFIIRCDLVEEREGGIYCRGAEERWQFLLLPSLAGQASAAARLKKYGTSQPPGGKQTWSQESNRNRTGIEQAIEQESNGIEPSSSSSSSFSKKENNTHEKAPDGAVSESVGVFCPDLKTFWNDHSGPLPKLSTLTNERKKKWAARWREQPALDYWVDVMQRITSTPFLTGSGHGKGTWRATVDWFLRPDTHVKVLEGSYGKEKNEDLKVWSENVF